MSGHPFFKVDQLKQNWEDFEKRKWQIIRNTKFSTRVGHYKIFEFIVYSFTLLFTVMKKAFLRDIRDNATDNNIQSYFDVLKKETLRFQTQPTGNWTTWLLDFANPDDARAVANAVCIIKYMASQLPVLYNDIWNKIIWHMVSDQPILLLWKSYTFKDITFELDRCYVFYDYNKSMISAVASLFHLHIQPDEKNGCYRAGFVAHNSFHKILNILRQNSKYTILVVKHTCKIQNNDYTYTKKPEEIPSDMRIYFRNIKKSS